MKGIESTGAALVYVPGWMDGLMDGWIDGWMGGCKSRLKDCLQQSKTLNREKTLVVLPCYLVCPKI